MQWSPSNKTMLNASTNYESTDAESLRYTYTYRHFINPQGWNLHYRAGYGLAPMYVGGSIFYQYPPTWV